MEIDSFRKYSVPKKVIETSLAKVFELEVRRSSERPGRALHVAYDTRQPLVEGFEAEYVYWVAFNNTGDQAGNHYHRDGKNEIFFSVLGEFRVFLEDPETKEREAIDLKSDEGAAVWVKEGIAHKVVAKSDGAVLLVITTSPLESQNEFPYEIAGN